MRHRLHEIVLGTWALTTAAGCAAGMAPPDAAPDTRVILAATYDDDVVWHFIPLDALPGGLDAAYVELPPPPPPPPAVTR